MARFKHKPIEIDAIKLAQSITINTESGYVEGQPGDFLVTSVDGKQHVVHRDLFLVMYQPMDEDARILMIYDDVEDRQNV